MRKRDIKLNVCKICHRKVSMQYIVSVEGQIDDFLGFKYYIVSCDGFGHQIVARHKRKDACMRLWNLINDGGQKGK